MEGSGQLSIEVEKGERQKDAQRRSQQQQVLEGGVGLEHQRQACAEQAQVEDVDVFLYLDGFLEIEAGVVDDGKNDEEGKKAQLDIVFPTEGAGGKVEKAEVIGKVVLPEVGPAVGPEVVDIDEKVRGKEPAEEHHDLFGAEGPYDDQPKNGEQYKADHGKVEEATDS